jgi:hypothetical protein
MLYSNIQQPGIVDTTLVTSKPLTKSSLTLEAGCCWHLIVFTTRFKTLWPSKSGPHDRRWPSFFFCLINVWLSPGFSGGGSISRGIGVQIVPQFPHSTGYKRNLPVMTWWNICTANHPIHLESYPAPVGARQVEVISQLESKLTTFQRKKIGKHWEQRF